MIPRFKPNLDLDELKVIFRSSKGAVKKFEKEFAKTFQAVDAVSFPYGRSALWAFLNAVEVKDAEVVMPAYTCSVVAHAISLSGNRPAFVDCSLTDYNMNLDLLPKAINEHTRAIIATHLFGYPLNLDRVEQIKSDAENRYGHKIWLIQDCAHSFGASWHGRMVGTPGDTALYALNISKMITAIFGGMLTFQDKDLADRVRYWRNRHFKQPGFFKAIQRRLYLLAVYGAFNEYVYGLTWLLQERTPFLNRLTKSYHLDDRIHFPPNYLDIMLNVEAAVGLQQLKKYPMIIENRRKRARWYDINLDRRDGWEFPPIVEGATYSHYVVKVEDRNKVVNEFARKGVHLGELIQYSIPELVEYKKSNIIFSNSELASKTTVNFPM
nr:DegT/DnrJ/EryC1/StrS family aminotransferase [uncultured Desulfobacter sp.]